MIYSRAIFALVWFAAPLAAATVRTLDGKTYDGDVRFEPGAIIVTQRVGSAVKLDPENLLQVQFPAREPAAPLAAAKPPQWTARDVGQTSVAMKVRNTAKGFGVSAAGAGLERDQDGFGFLYQPISGDAEITARVIGLGRIPLAMAGVMIRQTLAEDSPHASLVFDHEGGGMAEFIHRTLPNTPSQAMRAGRLRVQQLWLKLTRRGNTFTGLSSLDGTHWDPVGEPATFEMQENAYVGLCLTSHSRTQIVTAQFENVSVVSRPAVAPLGAAAEGAPAGPRVVMRSGAVLAADRLRSFDGENFRLVRGDGKEQTVRAADVARIVLRPLPAEMRTRIAGGRPGVLLARGDFTDGELKSVDDNRVRVSSVLFGLSTYDLKDVAAVVLRSAEAPRGRYVVRTVDGSVWSANALRAGKNELILDAPAAPPVSIPAADLYEIIAGGERMASLLDLRPPEVATGGRPASECFTVNATPAGVPMTLAGGSPVERGFGVAAGTALTWNIGGEYRTFLCRAGVPADLLPTTRVRFVVIGDGKELFRSPDRDSADDPAPVAVGVQGVKALTLKAQAIATDAASLGAVGVWAEPVLVKN